MIAFFMLVVLTIGSALTFLYLLSAHTGAPFLGIVLFGVLALLLACSALIAFLDLVHGGDFRDGSK